MTQSKDGMGRTQGATTRMPGQRSQGSGVGSGASGAIELPMLPHPSAVSSPSPSQPAGDTDEMQDLLRKIASQIADAEQRQGAALEGMQARLTDLAGQTEAVKSEAPKALQVSARSRPGLQRSPGPSKPPAAKSNLARPQCQPPHP
jgi:hypothetical protein